MKNDGGSIFPDHKSQCLQGGTVEHIGGMSLRDYFAANASEKDIQYYLVISEEMHIQGITDKKISREDARYEYADAMLKAREE